jgi:hypothetical protein
MKTKKTGNKDSSNLPERSLVLDGGTIVDVPAGMSDEQARAYVEGVLAESGSKPSTDTGKDFDEE